MPYQEQIDTFLEALCDDPYSNVYEGTKSPAWPNADFNMIAGCRDITLGARGFSCAVSAARRGVVGLRPTSASGRSRRDGEINLWYPGYRDMQFE